MFDWLRELTKSAEIRQQERVTAYVDNQLSEAERQQFEAQMRDDATLQADVALLQQLKSGLKLMPRAAAPRNFILDPAEFATPAPAYEARAYPLLRGATAMAGLMFMLLLVFAAFSSQSRGSMGAPVAMEQVTVEESAENAAAPEIVVEEAPAEIAQPTARSTSRPTAEPTAPIIAEVMEAAEEGMAEDVARDETEGAMEVSDDADFDEVGDVMSDAAPASESAAADMNAAGGDGAESAEAEPRSAEPMLIIPPTETPEQSKFTEATLAPTQTPLSEVSEPILSAEIQASDEIAEHDVIGTEINDPLLGSTVQHDEAQQLTLLQQLAIGLGSLFILMLIATLVIRRRLRQF